jgi:hypothetical protein
MDAIIAFFLTPWIFYSVIILVIFLEIIFASYEKFRYNTWFFLFAIVILWWHSKENWDKDLLQHIASNPVWSVILFVLYFVIGVGWSFIKWFSKLSVHNRKIKRIMNEYNASDKKDDPKYKSTIVAKILYYSNSDDINSAIKKSFPKVIDNKGNIIGWIIWWPFSMIGTIITDPLKRIGIFLYDLFGTWYQAIVDRMVKNLSVSEEDV